MSPTHSRRLDKLAVQIAPTPTHTWNENQRGFYEWISTPSMLTVVKEFAKDKARRRCLHAANEVAGSQHSGGSWTIGNHSRSWYGLTADERHQRIWRELEDLNQGMPFTKWLEEGDAAGWPPLPHTESTIASYLRRVAHDREMLAVHRSQANDLARAWRRDHPEWRRDMTPEEYHAWEITLIEKNKSG